VAGALLGQALIVSASHTSATVGGTVIVGRFNATGSLQESSQETVFVVGTGTAAGLRRNALRIDNNNNSNFTGSVNISGSLTSNGNVLVTGSLNVTSGFINTGSFESRGNSFALFDYNFFSSQIQMNATGSNGKIVLKSENVSISSSLATTVTGSLEIASGSGDLFMYGHKMFNVGDFYSTQTQTLAGGVSGSATYNNTGTTYGVTVVSSSRLTVENAGVYSITFSAQLKGDGGQDTIFMWLKKNGTNVADTATKSIVKNGEEIVMTVEYIVEAAASDYYEIAWQNLNGDGDLLYEAASGNIPAIPSIITTVKQVR
jgi:hypothetical protein